MTIRRDKLITLKPIGTDTYDVVDRLDNMLLNGNDSYFIYMKEVTFGKGIIKGRYLGKTTSAFIDEYCLDIEFNGSDFLVNDRVIERAKMVAIDNKNKTLVIIEE